MDDQTSIEPSANDQTATGRVMRLSSEWFLRVEHGIYIALGALLSLVAVVTLVSSAIDLWNGMQHWKGGEPLLALVDRLLFVLMMAEILHTVRVSIRSGTLNGEPFLIVGLIASIRRVLVITLESSQGSPGSGQSQPNPAVFRASMIELGVLAGLILIMVICIYLLRRRTSPDQAASG